MRVLGIALLLAAVAAWSVACDDGGGDGPAATGTAAGSAGTVTATPPPAADTATGVPDSFAGIAGLVPPHFPQPSADDWRTFYDALPGLGGWVGAYAAWTPDAGTPKAARTQPQVGVQFGFRVLPIVGFHQDTNPGVRLTVDFADTEQVDRFATDLAALAAETRPPYLGIGNEVNRIWEDDPAAFDAFVAALPGIVSAIHASAPETRVFVTLQYEGLRGAGALTGVERTPQWDLLDRIAPALDLVAFTTYPYFDYATPAEIPDDYYREAADRAGIAVAFSEIGWPSAPLSPAPDLPLGGTPEEQAAFIARLPALFEGAEPAFAMWSWAYDTPAVGPTFDSVALSDTNGVAKPALAEWRRFVGSR